LQTEVDTLKQKEDKLSYEVQHYKSVLSDTVCLLLFLVLHSYNHNNY